MIFLVIAFTLGVGYVTFSDPAPSPEVVVPEVGTRE